MHVAWGGVINALSSKHLTFFCNDHFSIDSIPANTFPVISRSISDGHTPSQTGV